MNQIEFVCSKFNSRLVGGEKGILRSLRCLLVLRTACTQLHSLPGVGQRSTGALPFPPFESPHLYAPTKKAPEWVLLLLAERKGFSAHYAVYLCFAQRALSFIRSPGWGNAPLERCLFHPSNPLICMHQQKKHPNGCFFCWRRERDSNP